MFFCVKYLKKMSHQINIESSTVKPVCNDHLYDNIYHLLFIP